MPQIMDDVTVDGTVTATRFIGPLTGTASRATADASGNGISSTYATKTAVAAKQDALVSGTNIKTINGTSLLGSGDITIGGLSGTVGDDTHPVKIVDGAAVAVADNLATELYATSPNVLVDNVSDWLHVSLTAKDSPYNRTSILTENVTTNRPQQAGDSIYCYFGTRYVFWQRENFVTVFVVGQGTDSGSHIWLNNYNANAGGWVGWKRTDFDQGYSSVPIEVFSTTLGPVVQVFGQISYHRVGPKKGLLSGTLRISSNGTYNFSILSLNNIGNALGVSFKNPSSNRTTGHWFSIDPDKTVWYDGIGYGSAFQIITDGSVQIGRIHNQVNFGGFPLSTLSNAIIVFGDVYVEEN